MRRDYGSGLPSADQKIHAAQHLSDHEATVYRLLSRYAVGETAQAAMTGVGVQNRPHIDFTQDVR